MGMADRKDCPMRHENGNCLPAGGFCTAVNDPICEALHNAFRHGESAEYERLTLKLMDKNAKYMQDSLETLKKIHEKVTEENVKVVRCKDCIYAELAEDGDLYCDGPIGIFGTVGFNDFCSCGERRKD